MVSLKTGALFDAADQVRVVCCPTGVRRRVKREEGARWGVMRRHSMCKKRNDTIGTHEPSRALPQTLCLDMLDSCTDNEQILSENPGA